MSRLNLKKSVKAACILAGLLCSTSAFAQSGPWKISEKTGDVSVGRSGVVKVAVQGSSLKAGDTIKTGKNGRAVLTRGEQYLVVAANSHIRIATPKSDGYMTQIVEYFGSVLFKVDKKKDKHFKVKTPYMAAVVKGTTFNVTVGAEGSTVQVTEGAVEVATLDGGATELLMPGNIGMVESADPFSLNIIGDDSRRIISPNKEAATTVAAKAAPRKIAAATPVVREIVNAPADLGSLTNGLIVGQTPGAVSTSRVAAISNSDARVASNVSTGGGFGDSGNAGGVETGNSVDARNDNAVGSVGSSGGGTDNGDGNVGDDSAESGDNGGGNVGDDGGSDDSSDDGGNGNDNGNVNGNGNNGNGGSDASDDNGGNGNNGIGGGNGNGNGGDNGNGNDGDGDNGVGNGGGDDAGDDDGGNGNGNNGNGSGNGGSNAGGDGGDDDRGNGNGNNGNGNGGSNRGGDDAGDDDGGNGNGNGNNGNGNGNNGNGNNGNTDSLTSMHLPGFGGNGPDTEGGASRGGPWQPAGNGPGGFENGVTRGEIAGRPGNR